MRVIILANGQNRLNHLVEIDGEPIISRTFRLLVARGVVPTVATSRIEISSLLRPEIPIYHPAPEPRHTVLGKSVVGLFSTTEPTLLLLGDVYFSEAAIDRMLIPLN